MARAFAYRRVSTSAQSEKYSLETQLEGIRAYCRERDIEIVEVFTEVHTGVELWERPALTQMRERVRNREADYVVVYTIDRLARDPVHLGVVLGEARHHGVEVLFVRDEVDDSPEGQLISFVRGFAAKIEHAQTRERTMRAKKAMHEKGLYIHSTPPYGYDVIFSEGDQKWHFTPNAQAPIVQQIYRWILEGWSQTAIVRELHRLGIPCPAQARKRVYKDGRVPNWTQPAIRTIVTNTVYKGEVYNNKYQVTKENGKRVARERPREEWIRVKNVVVEPLVSADDWELAQERLRGNGGAVTRNKSGLQYLLRGRIFCSVCGSPMYADMNNTTKYGLSDQVRIYRCGSRKLSRFGLGNACGAKLINARRVEAWVIEQLMELFSDEDAIRRQLEQRRQSGPDQQLQKELQSLLEQTAQIDVRIQRLRMDLMEETDERLRALLRQDMKALLDQQDAIQERIDNVQQQIINEQQVLEHIEHFTEYVRRVRINLLHADFEMKRKILEALDIKVYGQGKEWRMEGLGLDGNGLMRTSSRAIIRFTITSTSGPLLELIPAA